MTRHVIVHYHIYKNAGSSVERMLWLCFGRRFVMLDPSPGKKRVSGDAARRFVQARPAIRAISSHLFWPLVEMEGALPIVFFRHPLDRALSAYRFARYSPDVPDHEVARTSSFSEYVKWSLGRVGDGSVLRNHQVERLATGGFRAAGDGDLPGMLAFIDAMPALGLVRRFAESCGLFTARYKPLLREAHFRPTVQNTMGRHQLDEAAAIAEVRDALDAEAFCALEAANRLDIALYEHARAVFEARLRETAPPGRTPILAARLRQAARAVLLHSGAARPLPGLQRHPRFRHTSYARIGDAQG